MKKQLTLLALGGVFTLSPLSFVHQALAQSEIKQNTPRGVIENVGGVQIHWSEGVIRVTGVGAPPDRGNLSQKRLLAERAALSDAYRQLTEALNGVKVNAETIVRDYIIESDIIKTKVTGLIQGAQKVDQRYLSDDSVEVDMILKLHGKEGLNGILQPQKNHAPPPTSELKPEKIETLWTSVIVDCRGLNVKPAMSPAILAQSGGEVYIGNLKIDPDFVIEEGIVSYSRSLMDARVNKRAGRKPLIIKAVSGSGTFRTDVIIEDKDGEILLGLQKQFKLLEKAKVIFVL